MKTIFPIITEETQTLPFYLVGMGMQENQEHIFRSEGYSYYQISFCLSGEGIFYANGKKHLIKSGDGFYFRPNVPHEYESIQQPWNVKWLTFGGQKAAEIFNKLGLSDAGMFHAPEFHSMDLALIELYSKISSSSIFKEMECSADIYKIIILIAKWAQEYSDSPLKAAQIKLTPAIEYMRQNFARSISLEDIAHEINITPYYICRLFKQAYNITPFKYLIQLRVQSAKQLLLEKNDMPIRNISQECGFNDTSYFSAVFKQQEGITPGEFRRMHGL